MIDHKKVWDQILDTSGLIDLACEEHSHDLLDGHGGPANAPLDHTFYRLCHIHEALDWPAIEYVLSIMRTIDGFENLRLPDHAIDSVADLHFEETIGIADHTSIARGTYSNDWGTPAFVLNVVRAIYGRITHDLATSEEHNLRVCADIFWTADRPCPSDLALPSMSVIWCNPPGPRVLVEKFWNLWCNQIANGCFGGFLIFKQDHWRALLTPPFSCTCVVLNKRLSFIRSQAEIEHLKAKADREGKRYQKPSGANFPSTLVLPGDVRREIGEVLGPAVLWEPYR